MRAALLIAASASIAGCIPGDRVTLLTHSDGRAVGEVAVLDDAGGDDLAVLNQANQQVRLSGNNARVRQLDRVDPAYQELVNSLPVAADSVVLPGFRTGVGGLTLQQQSAIRRHMCKVEFRDGCEDFYPAECRNVNSGNSNCPTPVPGYQVLVRGFTDSEGDEQLNLTLSQERADAVASYMRSQGYEVAPEDVLGMGEFTARRTNGDEVPDPDFRRVDVVIR